jgi:hypothetical protein
LNTSDYQMNEDCCWVRICWTATELEDLEEYMR